MRSAARVISQTSPIAGAVVLFVGILGRSAGWTFIPTATALVVVAVALACWAVAMTRARAVTDPVAALLDADADLGGELRSASWFASVPATDAWIAHHLEAAARRLRLVSWNEVYPPVRARAIWLLAAALVGLAFAVPAGLPAGTGAAAAVPAAADLILELGELDGLPLDVQDEIAALLAAVREGRMTREEALARLRELNAFLEGDPERQQQIADLVEGAAADFERLGATGAGILQDAGQATGDVEWARENLASRLANEEAQQRDAGTSAEAEAKPGEGTGPATDQTAEGQSGEASPGQTGTRVPVKSADAADGAQGMMLSNSGSSVGEPGSLFG
jgi:hypothetical protein